MFYENRRTSREIRIGTVTIGGHSPIAVQSMTNTKTSDVRATLKQIELLSEAGCEIARVAVPDQASAQAIKDIVAASPMPVVADIHFDHRLAIAAIDSGAAKIRINPGNINDPEELAEVIDKAGAAGIPIRIGINSGSLPLHIEGVSVAKRLVKAAMEYVNIFESRGFEDMVLSVKASDVVETVEAYRALSQATHYPLHLGVTEAGGLVASAVRSTAAMSILFAEGIGDTLRVSITGDPVDEVKVAYRILAALDIRRESAEMVSCPTCGRCEIDLGKLAAEVEMLIAQVKKPLKIAVMGCAVNGPGEAKSADIGIAGGRGRGVIFVKGQVVASVPESQLLDEFRRQLELLTGQDPGGGRA